MESGARAEQTALFPLGPLPHIQCHNTAKRVVLPWRIPKTPPPYNLTGTPRQNMAEMKEQAKTPEKLLSDEERDNLSDAEFKTLVTRMLTELTELSRKMKEQMKDTQSEIKQNIQGTNSDGKETGTRINGLEEKEEINIQPE